MSTYPGSPALPLQASLLIDGTDPNVWVTSADGSSKFYILGGMMPWPGIPGQDGVVCTKWPSGMDSPFKHLDQQGALQDGTSWQATVYEPMMMTLPLEAHASTPQGLSRTVAEWKSTWDPKSPCTFEYWTLDRGYWYTQPRLMPGSWNNAVNLSPRRTLRQNLDQKIRVDDAFWKSIAVTTSFAPGTSGTHTGFLEMCNIGSEELWPSYLVYAGTAGTNAVTFGIGNGPDSSTLITFGPLLPGQIALLTTMPRLRSVIDMSPVLPTQTLTEGQKILEQLLDLITNNNPPPLLVQFESLFGILPPQGNMYSLLHGRWEHGVAGVPLPERASTSHITCSITNGNSDSKIIASGVPLRRWPE